MKLRHFISRFCGVYNLVFNLLQMNPFLGGKKNNFRQIQIIHGKNGSIKILIYNMPLTKFEFH